MAQQSTIPRSLVEQILDDMFANLEEREEFDVQTIQSLKKLAKRGGLTKPNQVAKSIERVQ
jgi:hypothetical protein